MPEPTVRVECVNSFTDSDAPFGGKKLDVRPRQKSAHSTDILRASDDPDEDDMGKHELDALV